MAGRNKPSSERTIDGKTYGEVHWPATIAFTSTRLAWASLAMYWPRSLQALSRPLQRSRNASCGFVQDQVRDHLHHFDDVRTDEVMAKRSLPPVQLRRPSVLQPGRGANPILWRTGHSEIGIWNWGCSNPLACDLGDHDRFIDGFVRLDRFADAFVNNISTISVSAEMASTMPI